MAHPTLDILLDTNELHNLLEITRQNLAIPPNAYLPDYNIYLGLMLSFAQLVLDRVSATPPNSDTHRTLKHALQTQLNELYTEMSRIAAFNLIHPLRNPYEQAASFFADKVLLLQWLATTATVEDLRYAATTRAKIY